MASAEICAWCNIRPQAETVAANRLETKCCMAQVLEQHVNSAAEPERRLNIVQNSLFAACT